MRRPAADAGASGKPIRIDVDMVMVNVTVIDPEDRLVLGLAKNNFRLYENDVEQEILTFAHQEQPISIGLLFDMSTSMADKLDRARETALQILKTANSQDEYFLVSFSDRAELTSGFTSDLDDLQRRMEATRPRGHTALLDAIHLAVQEMRGARYRKRALVVISDGGDNHSRYHEPQIRSELKEADCEIYALGIYDDVAHSSEERKGPELLSELAGLTGGHAFRVSNLDELPAVARKISIQLRDQYVLGYKPHGNRHDGAWRRIKVTVTPPAGGGDVRVYAKNGYYSPLD